MLGTSYFGSMDNKLKLFSKAEHALLWTTTDLDEAAYFGVQRPGERAAVYEVLWDAKVLTLPCNIFTNYEREDAKFKARRLREARRVRDLSEPTVIRLGAFTRHRSCNDYFGTIYLIPSARCIFKATRIQRAIGRK